MRPDLGRAELERHGLTPEFLTDTQACATWQAELGEPLVEHASPDDYEPDDLLDMFRFADCPLHLYPDYPDAPEGVWRRDFALAGKRLSEVTRHHLGLVPTSRSERLRRGPKVATAAEVEQVWSDYPHARWWWAKAAEQTPADDRRFDVELVEA